MQASELRKIFLEFFARKGHRVFPSDTLVPDDSSLLFTSAGMNQFKPYFLGEKKDLSCAVSCQKCLRTGDLDNVGRTPYHHTFFEMLGNFSFGSYFKKEAIRFSWQFLTEELKMKEKNLWVSVYEEDSEAFSIWRDEAGLPKKRIVKLGQEANFWPASAPALGPDGPCGPCSEVFFDRGENTGCKKAGCNPGCSCGRFVEVWNLVFTQFNRVAKNKLAPLPQKNIDTGMGLERIASVLQGKDSNFQIDILKPLVDFTKDLLPFSGTGLEAGPLINAIVDHTRAVIFAIADGVYPSNEDRGYVVRKLIRTALLKGSLLGAKSPLLYRLLPLSAELMKDAYPEIEQRRDILAKIIFAEEEKFLATLKEGKKRLEALIDECRKEKKKVIGAEKLFRLYDTHGVPLELSKALAAGGNLGVDEKGFRRLLAGQQELSRKKSMFEQGIFKQKEVNFKEVSKFVGYEKEEAEANILKLVAGGKEAGVLAKGKTGYLILDKTPFYPESGGQLSDTGRIKTKKGEFSVESVVKVAEAIVHKGKVVKGEIGKGAAEAVIDKERRSGLMRAHTATHLLQAALRKILGEHVMQQGSLVDVDRFRFDFTHFRKLTAEEAEKVEKEIKKFILQADKVGKQTLTLKEAKKAGALAFFKEKYRGVVRVVSIAGYSKELCAGTHLDNTKEVGDFIIRSQSSVSSGIRRIEGLVGEKATAFRAERKETPAKKGSPASKKEKEEFNEEALALQTKVFISPDTGKVIGLERVAGINFFAGNLTSGLSSKAGQSRINLVLSDRLKKAAGSIFIFIVTTVCGKDIFICSATEDLLRRGVSCKEFVSRFKKELSLAGGGSDRVAQGSIAEYGNDFFKKLKECFAKFVNQ